MSGRAKSTRSVGFYECVRACVRVSTSLQPASNPSSFPSALSASQLHGIDSSTRPTRCWLSTAPSGCASNSMVVWVLFSPCATRARQLDAASGLSPRPSGSSSSASVLQVSQPGGLAGCLAVGRLFGLSVVVRPSLAFPTARKLSDCRSFVRSFVRSVGRSVGRSANERRPVIRCFA